jgi:hypothetical protein
LEDFWTTRCTRCPKALDRLDRLAAEEKEKNNNAKDEQNKVTFVSICCGDKLDGAREILEKDDELKWPNFDGHYYMDATSKEIAKSVLGFASVPFYVMVNASGDVTQKGNSKNMDWTQLSSSSAATSTTSTSTTDALFVSIQTLAVDTAPSLDQENQPVQQPKTAATTTSDHAKLLEKTESTPAMAVAKEPAVAAAASTTEQQQQQTFVLDDLDF